MMKQFWLINLVLFQLTWFSCALLTAEANWLTPLLLLLHFSLSPNKIADGKLLAVAAVGVIIDFILFKVSLISFSGSNFPFWLICLWCMFTISVNHSLAWLSKCKAWLIAIIGAFGGASSYFAAVQFGALSYHGSTLSLWLIYGAIWALFLPLLIVYQARFVKIINS